MYIKQTLKKTCYWLTIQQNYLEIIFLTFNQTKNSKFYNVK